jgi:hypothetical protein
VRCEPLRKVDRLARWRTNAKSFDRLAAKYEHSTNLQSRDCEGAAATRQFTQVSNNSWQHPESAKFFKSLRVVQAAEKSQDPADRCDFPKSRDVMEDNNRFHRLSFADRGSLTPGAILA